MPKSLILLFLYFGAIKSTLIRNTLPEQVHIAFGEDPCSSISVTWSTKDPAPEPKVQYGTGKLDSETTGFSKIFVDGGEAKRVQYVHRVILTGLMPATKYGYRCGSDEGWSEQFSFRTANCSGDWSPKVAVYGDMGTTDAVIRPAVEAGVRAQRYDAVLHIGDFAYDMKDDDGRVGDEFMRQIESVAANVPYMVCPGNHENAYNFSHYRERFTMPGNSESLFYSFNLGPAHFISINTEAYYYLEYGDSALVNQYDWLVKDLKEANSPANREERPWIIIYGHRPMYCSNVWIDDCSYKTTKTRIGLKKGEWYEYGLEELMYTSGVDLVFWGHEHSYERLWPVFDYQVKNGSLQSPYTEPKGPVHITTGAAGSKYHITSFSPLKPYWSAFRSEEYGYTLLDIRNKTHLNIQQISVTQVNKPVDNIWLIRAHHGPFEEK